MRHYGSIKTFLAIVFVLISLGVILLLWIGHLDHKVPHYEDNNVTIPQRPSTEKEDLQIMLYFGSDGDIWHTETRYMSMATDKLEERLRYVIEELLKGPKERDYNPFPKDTRLLSLFLDQDGIVYVDFSEEIKTNHPGGTWGEMMTIYSLVNTILDNFQPIKGVKILIMGREAETLKGHLDIRYPFEFRKHP